jgi:general secretion pathway protein G
MFYNRRSAFTMLELVFVIVVIGILSAIAVPKLAATRDDAVITKARNTVAAVRSAMATERQKRILRGDFTPITSLHSGTSYVFNAFDGNTSFPVLEYPVAVCKSGQKGCWKIGSGTGKYDYVWPTGSHTVTFTVNNNRFDCDHTDSYCKQLTE